ncbi:YciI family protein [Silvimonas amylolytica]|uniref:YCII-related domain-containing protein n=1 Tax=Silvimonas amylolytica TaxID=449663 RepID=A0ABQ2PQC9_9NEIS|nr:YciI family protein [Silvimonas amylolytica]GGP27518.1 hypothetical protein GCM10010971_33370 [Silvimonas amylolytica]
MYVLTASYAQSPAAVEPHIASHAAWVKRYLDAGVFLAAGPKRSGLGGVILVHVPSREALREILAEDSYVIADVVNYTIDEIEFKATVPELAALKGI